MSDSNLQPCHELRISVYFHRMAINIFNNIFRYIFRIKNLKKKSTASLSLYTKTRLSTMVEQIVFTWIITSLQALPGLIYAETSNHCIMLTDLTGNEFESG